MNKIKIVITITKIIKIILMVILAIVAILLAIRFFGKMSNSKTPKGGINESFYVDINGSKQWISIYGKNRNNPVLLYLHGGPGSATSAYEYKFTRKWSDVYTVVTWDQRDCGKSYFKNQEHKVLTYDLFMQDGLEMTEFLINYFHKEKISLLGHSWGSLFGANLALAYPKYYDIYIGTGQCIDLDENEIRFVEAAKEWVKGDAEGEAIFAKLHPENFDYEHLIARNTLMEKYGYGMMSVPWEYNPVMALFFNPYYSLHEVINYLNDYIHLNVLSKTYEDFTTSEELNKFSLAGRTKYQIPYYNINGDKDYQTNYRFAAEYFEEVKAPRKAFYLMHDMTHALLEAQPEAFSKYVHEIAKLEKEAKIN